MKTFNFFSTLIICFAFVSTSVAQSVTDTIPVSGNCGMCKTNIEKAAKKAGATDADWNTETKVLTVKYSSSSTSAARIQQAIAGVGYDTRDFKAADEAYDKLHACCKYDRVKKEEQPSAAIQKDKSCCSKEEGMAAANSTDKSCCTEAH